MGGGLMQRSLDAVTQGTKNSANTCRSRSAVSASERNTTRISLGASLTCRGIAIDEQPLDSPRRTIGSSCVTPAAATISNPATHGRRLELSRVGEQPAFDVIESQASERAARGRLQTFNRGVAGGDN